MVQSALLKSWSNGQLWEAIHAYAFHLALGLVRFAKSLRAEAFPCS